MIPGKENFPAKVSRRVLLVLGGFLPKPLFGINRHGAELARELLERGIEVGLFYPAEHGPREVDLGAWGLQGVRLFAARYDFAAATGALAPWLEMALFNFQPEVVHVLAPRRLPLEIAEMCGEMGARLVLTLSDFWPVCPAWVAQHPREGFCLRPGARRCARCLADHARLTGHFPQVPAFGRVWSLYGRENAGRRLLEAADVLLVPSQFMRDKLREGGFGLEKARLLPPGIPVGPEGRKRREAARKGNSAAGGQRRQGRLTFGFLNHARPGQGLERLLQTFVTLRGARLLVYGVVDPADRARYRELFPDPRIRLEPYALDLDAAFAEMDVLVIPAEWPDPVAFNLREALARGVPAICPRHSVFPELVQDQVTSLFFDPLVEGDLAAKMKTLLDRPEAVAYLAQNLPEIKPLDGYAAELEVLYSSGGENAPR